MNNNDNDKCILKLPKPQEEGMEENYPLDDINLKEQLNYFKSKLKNMKDEDEIKKHIIKIKEKAYNLFNFPCVLNFDFVRGKVVNHPSYKRSVKLIKDQNIEQKIFIDFGAGMGSDLRQVISQDGWNRQDVLAIDVKPEWIELSYELFQDSNEPIPYFIGDIFNQDTFDIDKPKDENLPKKLDLFSIKDLNCLKGRASIISAFFLFHLFGGKDQELLVEYLVNLLSDQPGSTILGMQRGTETEGLHTLAYASESNWYSHSAESWRALWEKFFEPGSVEIISELKESTPENQFRYIHGERKILWLYWSITRL